MRPVEWKQNTNSIKKTLNTISMKRFLFGSLEDIHIRMISQEVRRTSNPNIISLNSTKSETWPWSLINLKPIVIEDSRNKSLWPPISMAIKMNFIIVNWLKACPWAFIHCKWIVINYTKALLLLRGRPHNQRLKLAHCLFCHLKVSKEAKRICMFHLIKMALFQALFWPGR